MSFEVENQEERPQAHTAGQTEKKRSENRWVAKRGRDTTNGHVIDDESARVKGQGVTWSAS